MQGKGRRRKGKEEKEKWVYKGEMRKTVKEKRGGKAKEGMEETRKVKGEEKEVKAGREKGREKETLEGREGLEREGAGKKEGKRRKGTIIYVCTSHRFLVGT